MLRRVSVEDVKSGRISKETAYLVVAMRFYPRFLRRERVDEYARPLAPDAALFSEFKERQRKLANHNAAFHLVAYEKRFALTPEGEAKLAELVALARERDVALVCQCRDFERCHCDLLLLRARERHGAEIHGLLFEYPDYLERASS